MHPTTANARSRLIAGLALCSLPVHAGATEADAATTTNTSAKDQEIIVTGYQSDGLTDSRRPLPLLDTPVVATVITDQLLAEQGRRTLRDSLRNISGISFQAGEGNPPGGGDNFSIRGFSARDDVMVDGIRDPGNYFRDPFNADRFEVTKGPASTLAGRGNIGGTVNVVSRLPTLTDRIEGEVGAGTDAFVRGTLDANVVLDEAAGIAVRFNAVGHRNDEPGRDVVTSKRWGVNPSISAGLGGDTTVTASYFYMQQDDLPDGGIPNARNRSLAGSGQEGRIAPVDRRSFFGHGNDFRDVETNIATLFLRHAFNDAVAVRNTTRWAQTDYAQNSSSPRFVGTVTALTPATQVVGNIKPRNQRDQLVINKSELDLRLGDAGFRHSIVLGLEVSDEYTRNRRRLDINGPPTNLFNPVLRDAPPIPFNGTSARIDVNTVSLYAYDTVEFGDAVFLSAGVRHDWVDSRARGLVETGVNLPGFVTDLSIQDREWSGNVGITYKPAPWASLFAAWGTSFEPSARAEVVQIAGGNNNPPVTAANFNVEPERSRAFEVGAKAEIGTGMQLTVSIFELTKTNARTPGIDAGDPPVVLDGRQRVRGIEFQAAGKLLPGWDVFASYTHLDGEVTRSNIPVQVGLPLDNSPPHSASVWTGVEVAPRLRVGGGVQYVGKRRSNIPSSLTSGNFVITAPDYVVLDAFAEFAVSERVKLRLNGYNLANAFYIQSISSGQSIPGAGQSATATLALRF